MSSTKIFYFSNNSHSLSSKSTPSASNPSVPVSAAAFLISQGGRYTYKIIGDGNCLFRSFSYILYNTQDRHFEMRAVITEFTISNAAYFNALCYPDSVQDHVCRMKNEETI